MWICKCKEIVQSSTHSLQPGLISTLDIAVFFRKEMDHHLGYTVINHHPLLYAHFDINTRVIHHATLYENNCPTCNAKIPEAVVIRRDNIGTCSSPITGIQSLLHQTLTTSSCRVACEYLYAISHHSVSW